MNYEDKSGGYPHPQQQGMPAMPMPMPPTYDQTGQNPGLYPPMPAPPPQSHIHYVAPHPPPMMNEPVNSSHTHTIIIQPQVGPDPTMVTCPSCRQTVVTRMEYESSTRTHVAAGILCILGCWLCCCIPYCMDSCQNGNHYCPSCGSFLGTYRS